MSGGVQIIEEGDRTLRLEAALMLYSSPGGDVYTTRHAILLGKNNKPVLGPGVPASGEELSSFCDAVRNATAYRGLVPDNLLYIGPQSLAWWVPACTRRVWFSCDEIGIEKKSAEVQHPPLLFAVVRNGWYIFALQTNERPQAKTPLFKAPYFNIWQDGRVCTGNVDLPAEIDMHCMKGYENAFFRSHFAHPNDTKLTNYKGGINALWRDQLADPSQPLLAKYMVKRQTNLEQMLASIQEKA